MSYQLSVISYQLSFISYQLSVISWQLTGGKCAQETAATHGLYTPLGQRPRQIVHGDVPYDYFVWNCDWIKKP